MTMKAQLRLRGFLHRMGHDAKQGEIGIVIGNKYYGITEFDLSEGGAPDRAERI
ncbi:MAG: hypothetical protein JO159_17360 [Acidobacteria bacterium]|nr:hypothetical protein [Acidobacteriota bacterium]MBV9623858.1 hypothetical protein [Acidobacteriota bacterium]